MNSPCYSCRSLWCRSKIASLSAKEPTGPPLWVGWQFEKQLEAARLYALPEPTPLSLPISNPIPTLRLRSWFYLLAPITGTELKHSCHSDRNRKWGRHQCSCLEVDWFGAKTPNRIQYRGHFTSPVPETEMGAPLTSCTTWPEKE